MIYYLYNDEDFQLIGIDKTTCSALKMDFLDGEINDITFLVTPSGNVYPEEEIPLNIINPYRFEPPISPRRAIKLAKRKIYNKNWKHRWKNIKQ